MGGAETAVGGFFHAFLYSNGQMIDLNNLIGPALGGVSLATGINDESQIVANSSDRAFLLTPEPGTLAFLGAALLVLIASVYTSRRSDQAQD